MGRASRARLARVQIATGGREHGCIRNVQGAKARRAMPPVLTTSEAACIVVAQVDSMANATIRCGPLLCSAQA